MTSTLRRVVTGNDATGRSRVVFDGPLPTGSVAHDRFVWTSGVADEAKAPADGAGVRHRLEPPPGGSIFRVIEFPPASALAGLSAEAKAAFFQELFEGMGAAHCLVDTSRSPGMHKTASLDYVVVLRGEVTLILDDGEVTLKPGDVAVQQGANHDWIVPGDEPVLVAVVMLGGAASSGSERRP